MTKKVTDLDCHPLPRADSRYRLGCIVQDCYCHISAVCHALAVLDQCWVGNKQRSGFAQVSDFLLTSVPLLLLQLHKLDHITLIQDFKLAYPSGVGEG
jgi:hypothetical protein